MKIGLIGCGHMGSAMAKALIKRSGKTLVFAGSPHKPRLTLAPSEQKRFRWNSDNRHALHGVDMLVVAVKPGMVPGVLREIKKMLKKTQILISIVAGTPLKKLSRWSGGHKKIVRAMPNLPAQMGEGMSVWKAASGLTPQEKSAVANFFKTFGHALEVADEKQIDMATAVAGGGPAYMAAFLESMTRASRKAGFSADDARSLVLQSAFGSIRYLQETAVDFGALKKAVQTKGGTTEAGFKILKKKKWQAALEQALLAGYQRARKISLTE